MYRLAVIGFSAGGVPAMQRILAALPLDYPLALAIVAHLPPGKVDGFVRLLQQDSRFPLQVAGDKQPIRPGQAYLAPADYHLLVEDDRHFALSVDARVHAVRPSIDVLFESAAEVFEHDLIAVILSGANADGAAGMARVKALGGVTIVLDPQQTDFRRMPEAVIATVDVDYVVDVEQIIALLLAVD